MARKDSKLEDLARVPLFSACSKKELGMISRASDEVTVPAGKILTEEGKPGYEFYLLVDGQVTVKRGGRKVATLGPGKSFGELALLTRAPRNATVVTDTDSKVLVLGQREFSGLLDEVPGLAHKLLTSLAVRLQEADARAVEH